MSTPSPTENLPAKPKAKPGLLTLFFVPILLTYAIYKTAACFGYVPGGLELFACVIIGAFLSLFVVSLTDLIVRRFFPEKRKMILWVALFICTPLINLYFMYGEYHTSRGAMAFPIACPADVQVIRCDTTLFDSLYHFKCSPESMAKIMQSKSLTECALDIEDIERFTNTLDHHLAHYVHSYGWWQPTNMWQVRAFDVTHNESDGRGYFEEWIVNGKSNEAFVILGD